MFKFSFKKTGILLILAFVLMFTTPMSILADESSEAGTEVQMEETDAAIDQNAAVEITDIEITADENDAAIAEQMVEMPGVESADVLLAEAQAKAAAEAEAQAKEEAEAAAKAQAEAQAKAEAEAAAKAQAEAQAKAQAEAQAKAKAQAEAQARAAAQAAAIKAAEARKTTITLNKTKVSINKGKKKTLKATLKNAKGKKVVWKSSNKKVATVTSKGVVKAKKKGKATITATIKGTSIKAKCTVTVTNIVTMRVRTTGYCNCRKCCGKWAGGRTASGTKPKQGRTIAVDRRLIKLGTKVVIDGKTYIAEDTGSAIKGKKIDIYYSSHKAAQKHGVKYKKIKVYK